ncbi:CDP-alcohol phosphatidyltransferase family protein [Candidatus Uhrbacteria bacterium]|nr:CDP-alcohol phosphatidyltransferase family protein [Candidatus Uhrbacteria bacterium]
MPPPMTNETARLYPHDHLMKWIVLPLIPASVYPNHLTILRFFLTPLVLFFLVQANYRWGVPLFIFAAFTDAIDGSLARARRQITRWGTFYDPVADKILIGSVLIFIVLRHINLWFGLTILGVEALIILGGLYQRMRGIENGSNVYGKTKMVLQVVAVSFLLLSLWFELPLLIYFSVATFAVAILFAGISLFTYGI